MRVIAGTARSLALKTLPGNDTRPTTDRIKETLFNMIGPLVADARFLDLFSGSGAIGIEALSRGAKEAVLVEQNRKACDVIRENLRFTRLEGNARVMQADVVAALRQLENDRFHDETPSLNQSDEQSFLRQLKNGKPLDMREPEDCGGIRQGKELGQVFDIIFMDPPYNMDHERRVLEVLTESPLMDEETLVIVEASIETDFAYLDRLGFRVVKRKVYKTNVHMFIRRA